MARYVESVASWAILRIEGEGVQRKSTGFCARRDGALLIGSVLSVVGRCSVVGRLNAVRGVRIDGARPRDGPGVPRVLRKGDRDHCVQRPHLLPDSKMRISRRARRARRAPSFESERICVNSREPSLHVERTQFSSVQFSSVQYSSVQFSLLSHACVCARHTGACNMPWVQQRRCWRRTLHRSGSHAMGRHERADFSTLDSDGPSPRSRGS